MNKHFLLQKMSIIHAIKCNRTSSFDEASHSFDKLNELKILVVNAKTEETKTITNQIDAWAGSEPIATENEIRKLMTKK